jgi:hypothetical protein
LRDEKKALQSDIADLLAVRGDSSHSLRDFALMAEEQTNLFEHALYLRRTSKIFSATHSPARATNTPTGLLTGGQIAG